MRFVDSILVLVATVVVAAAFPLAPTHITSASESEYSVVKLSRAVLAVDDVFAQFHLADLHCRSLTTFCHTVRRAVDAVAEAALDGYDELSLLALGLANKQSESLCGHDGIHCLERRDVIMNQAIGTTFEEPSALFAHCLHDGSACGARHATNQLKRRQSCNICQNTDDCDAAMIVLCAAYTGSSIKQQWSSSMSSVNPAKATKTSGLPNSGATAKASTPDPASKPPASSAAHASGRKPSFCGSPGLGCLSKRNAASNDLGLTILYANALHAIGHAFDAVKRDMNDQQWKVNVENQVEAAFSHLGRIIGDAVELAQDEAEINSV